jgi:hypothetical protein
MNCPHCGFVQADQNRECPKCGIVFEKFEKYRHSPPERQRPGHGRKEERSDAEGSLRGFLFFVESEVNPFYFAGRVLIFLVIFLWGWKFILTPMGTNYVGDSFLHLVNLPFHEAGHIFFSFFGRWVTSLGGTLGQLLIPLVCLLVFLLKSQNPFGASVALWWLGESFMDIAPYIGDARAQNLLLLGGVTGKEADYGYHDWEFILGEIGLLRYDRILAQLADKFGTTLMLLAFTWAGCLLLKQYRNLDWTPKAPSD